MKTQLCIIKLPENKRPSLCLRQGGIIYPLATLNHSYSEHLITQFLGGHNAIEKDCDFIVDDLVNELGEWIW